MLRIISTTMRERLLRCSSMLFPMATALLGMAIIASEHGGVLFPFVVAQAVTDSSEAPPDVQFESQISTEGSVSIVIFLVAAFLLVRWALREKRQPGKRYHRSFASLCAEDSDKRHRYRPDLRVQQEDMPESGGDGHAGSD